MRTALIATVLNEAAGIREFLGSMETLSRMPDVIVVTDGGSTDGTLDLLAEFSSSTSLPFRFSQAPDQSGQASTG